MLHKFSIVTLIEFVTKANLVQGLRTVRKQPPSLLSSCSVMGRHKGSKGKRLSETLSDRRNLCFIGSSDSII